MAWSIAILSVLFCRLKNRWTPSLRFWHVREVIDKRSEQMYYLRRIIVGHTVFMGIIFNELRNVTHVTMQQSKGMRWKMCIKIFIMILYTFNY